MKTCIILNPNAGSATPELAESLQALPDATLHTTAAAGDGGRLAAEAIDSGYELIVAAGGDGTINEVLNGLVAGFGRIKFGIVPLGTGNDLVRTLNIPTELDAALDLIRAGHTQAVDVVRVQCGEITRYSLNVCAGGFSGLLNEKLTDEIKQAWGPFAYLRSGLETIPELTSYHTTIVLDDSETLEVDTYNVVVANGRYVASGIPIAPTAELSDGLVDLIVMPAASLPQLVLLVPQILLGKHLENEQIILRQAHKLKISSEPGMSFNTDGELIGNDPISFEVLPQALEIIVPLPVTA